MLCQYNKHNINILTLLNQHNINTHALSIQQASYQYNTLNIQHPIEPFINPPPLTPLPHLHPLTLTPISPLPPPSPLPLSPLTPLLPLPPSLPNSPPQRHRRRARARPAPLRRAPPAAAEVGRRPAESGPPPPLLPHGARGTDGGFGTLLCQVHPHHTTPHL